MMLGSTSWKIVYVRGSMVDIDILKYHVMVFHSAPSFGGYLIHQKQVNSSISINQNYTSWCNLS
jgi:hypothetical protein